MTRMLVRERRVHTRILADGSLRILAVLSFSCGARSGLSDLDVQVEPPPRVSCSSTPTPCVARSAVACTPPFVVRPVCDSTTLTWTCPSGSLVYERAPAASTSCNPFTNSAGRIANVGGSLPGIPLDDGRCLWVADDVQTQGGQQVEDVGFVPDLRTPFGACPGEASFVNGTLESIVHIESGDTPSLFVQISGAYRLEGQLRVLYRMFRRDPTVTYGRVLLGSGLGRWDASIGRIVVPGVDGLLFSPALDLGNASWVDASYAYVWGCSGPGEEFLTSACVLGRLDAQRSTQLYAGAGDWVDSLDRNSGVRTFDDGPWISSVLRNPTGTSLLHVYTVGFASSVSAHSAPQPEGPWTALGTLGECDLPGEAGDYCQGPFVHPELADPTQRGEMVVSLRLGNATTGAEYWTRLAWLRAP